MKKVGDVVFRKMTKQRPNTFPVGQALIMAGVFTLLYTYFYQTYYHYGLYGFGLESVLLAVVTVLSGILIELGRFLGGPVVFSFKPELLIMQGIPAGLLGLVPGSLWLDLFGRGYPFNFLADPGVSGAAGVWFGIILLRSLIDQKPVPEKEEQEEREKKPREAY